MKRSCDNFGLSDLTGALDKVTSFVDTKYSDVQTSLAPLTPFADAMKQMLNKVGVKPPDNINDLAKLFSVKVASPAGANGATVTDQILNFIKAQYDASRSGANLSGVNKIAADSAKSFLSVEGIKDLVTSPVFLIAVATVVGIVIFMRK